jgi:GGDEF domain-containing protein
MKCDARSPGDGACLTTLGTFLGTRPSGEQESYIRALNLLLQGVELHTLEHNREDYESLKAELAGFQRALLPKTAVPEVFVVIGKAIRALEEYSRRSAGRLRAQFSELKNINATLSNALTGMVSTSEASLVRLQEIQTQLSSAERVDDLRLVKKRLRDCLNHMAVEVKENREAAERTGAIRPGDVIAVDAVTGLPAQVEAETMLSHLAEKGIPAVAVVLALKRLKHVNARYGYGAGDSLLAKLAKYVRSGVSVGEGPYRWRGPALMAIITKNVYFDQIRHEIGRLITDMPEFQIDVGGRTATILPSVGWSVFPVAQPLEKLVRDLEEFVVHQNAEPA